MINSILIFSFPWETIHFVNINTTTSAINYICARERHKTASLSELNRIILLIKYQTFNHHHIRSIRFGGLVTHIRSVSFSLFTTDFPVVCAHFNRKRIKIYRCLSIYTSRTTRKSKEHSTNPFHAHSSHTHTDTPKLPVTSDDGTNKHPHTHDRQRRRSKLHFSLLHG